jgi:hypothetical protein
LPAHAPSTPRPKPRRDFTTSLDTCRIFPQARIEATLTLLGQDFCTSANSNHRKGGLIALAAAAIGLTQQHIKLYLDLLLPPVLHCFDDPESRVRYSRACPAPTAHLTTH